MASEQTDFSTAIWRKSSYSNGSGGDCVEIADHIPGIVPVRDSKAPEGPALLFSTPAWTSFVGTLKVEDEATSIH